MQSLYLAQSQSGPFSFETYFDLLLVKKTKARLYIVRYRQRVNQEMLIILIRSWEFVCLKVF